MLGGGYTGSASDELTRLEAMNRLLKVICLILIVFLHLRAGFERNQAELAQRNASLASLRDEEARRRAEESRRDSVENQGEIAEDQVSWRATFEAKITALRQAHKYADIRSFISAHI